MNVQLLAVDGLISFCLSLVWVTLLALARRAWWPEMDVRLVLLFGLGVFALVFTILDVMQNGLQRWHNGFWQLVKWIFAAFVFVKGIQIVMAAMGAG